MKQLLLYLGSVLKIGEALAIWADPKRREVVKLRMAVEAAENLFQIQHCSGAYKSMPPAKIAKYIVHWTKRWEAFKDGV
jgi:hypothetical protein